MSNHDETLPSEHCTSCSSWRMLPRGSTRNTSRRATPEALVLQGWRFSWAWLPGMRRVTRQSAQHPTASRIRFEDFLGNRARSGESVSCNVPKMFLLFVQGVLSAPSFSSSRVRLADSTQHIPSANALLTRGAIVLCSFLLIVACAADLHTCVVKLTHVTGSLIWFVSRCCVRWRQHAHNLAA